MISEPVAEADEGQGLGSREFGAGERGFAVGDRLQVDTAALQVAASTLAGWSGEMAGSVAGGGVLSHLVATEATYAGSATGPALGALAGAVSGVVGDLEGALQTLGRGLIESAEQYAATDGALQRAAQGVR